MDNVESFRRMFGYNGTYGNDGFPIPGELMKWARGRSHMTQERLASLLGISRSMVARMESTNSGFESIVTRRNIAKALGIIPAALGLVDSERPNGEILYDTSILKKAVQMHRECYLSGGDTGGINTIDEMITSISRITSGLRQKNREMLEVLFRYYQLGVDVAREKRDNPAVNRYARQALNLAKTLKNKEFQASVTLRYCAALHERGDLEQAKKYAHISLQYVDNVPPSLAFGIYTHAARPLASNESKQALTLVEKAYTLSRLRNDDGDPGWIKPSGAFAQIWMAYALIEAGQYVNAINILDAIQEQTHYTRRHCIIRTLQARALLGIKEYEQASLFAKNACDVAQTISSALNLGNIGKMYHQLTISPARYSSEVKSLGLALQRV